MQLVHKMYVHVRTLGFVRNSSVTRIIDLDMKGSALQVNKHSPFQKADCATLAPQSAKRPFTIVITTGGIGPFAALLSKKVVQFLHHETFF